MSSPSNLDFFRTSLKLYVDHPPSIRCFPSSNLCAPIDNHHPLDPARRIYSDLGRQLTEADIGKKVLRTSPRLLNDGSYDWSWVPRMHEVECHIDTLYEINDNRLRFEGNSLLGFNDGHWITLDEWNAHFKNNPDRAIPQKSSSDYFQQKNATFETFSRPFIHPLNEPQIEFAFLKDRLEFSWFKRLQASISRDFFPKDYAVDHAKLEPSTSKNSQVDPNKPTPHSILGLPEGVYDLEMIKKHYYFLCLKFHPDKNLSQADGEQFLIIAQAYQLLLSEVQGVQFVASLSLEGDDDYSKADYCFTNFHHALYSNKQVPLQQLINNWEGFVNELEKTQKKPFTKATLKLRFDRLILQSSNILSSLQVQLKIEHLISFKNLDPSLTTTKKILEKMSDLEAMITAYDLNNQKFTWSYESIEEVFNFVNYLILDKYVALARCAIEIYAKLNLPSLASALKNATIVFLKNRKEAIQAGKALALVHLLTHFAYFNHSSSQHDHTFQKSTFDNPTEQSEESTDNTFQKNKFPPFSSNQYKPNNEIETISDHLPNIDRNNILLKNIENNQTILNSQPLFENIFSSLEKFLSILDFERLSLTKELKTIPSFLFDPSLQLLKPIQKPLSEFFSKWHVPLTKSACLYKKNTDDFGVEIKEWLISAKIEEGDSLYALGFRFKHLFKNLEQIADKLGIAVKSTQLTYPVRDHFFKMHTGETRLQHISDKIDEAFDRAQSYAFYFGLSGLSKTTHRFFSGKGGIAHKQFLKTIPEYRHIFPDSRPLRQYAEGGNQFTLTNKEGKIQILLGIDHLYTNKNLRQDKKIFSLIKDTYGQYFISNFVKNQSSEKICKVAEKMYAQGLLDDQKGFVDFQKLSKIVQTVLSDKSSKVQSFKDYAIQQGVIKPFSLEKTQIEKYKSSVTNYLYEKYIINKFIAVDFNVQPEDMHFLPQVLYHLDTFIKPGPKHSVFVADFAMNADLCRRLIENADALHLSNADRICLRRFLHSSVKLDQQLSPLLEKVRKKIQKANLTPISMPGVFFDADLQVPTCNFNFMNALSGWSAKTQKYFYITSGVQIGDQLGSLFMEIFTQFLRNYQPNLDVFYVGHPPENPNDFSESMSTWNNVRSQAGIHCFSFETKTNSHHDQGSFIKI